METAIMTKPVTRSLAGAFGRRILGVFRTIHEMGAFGLITLGITLTKFNHSRKVIHPLIRHQIFNAGLRQLPAVGFVGMALGLVVVGQALALLSKVGAQEYTGTIMVTVIIRELGPLATAILVLARVGTSTVIELGTSRAMGEVEALEALGIDPIHYLVMPRVIGLALAVFALTMYLIVIALGAGYFFALIEGVKLGPWDYLGKVNSALRWEDFVVLVLKTTSFGIVIAVTTCYEGLAKPLNLQEVAQATTRAVMYGLDLCLLLDVIFLLYLLL